MSNEGEKRCPLCAEEMDWTDQQFKPCKCGYQVCVWCWHHIMDMAEKDETEGRCPACRTIYEKDKIVAMQANCERAVAKNSSRKSKPPKAKPKTNEVRKDLSNVRVIQRKMAYVIGLPLNLADEDLLQRKEYFGQYGKVSKISLSRTAGGAIQHFIHDTCSVYVTYSKEEEAVRCIQSVHGFVLEGRFLRASFGTAKYCHAWLRNMPCSNPTCLYLHTIGADEDSFGKDEVAAVHTRHRVQEVAGATNNMLRRSGNFLPPPVEEMTTSGSSFIGKSTAKSSFSDSVYGGHLAGGLGVPNKTTFVDIVGRSSSSGPEKDENNAEDRRILDLCSDLSSVAIDKANHVEDTFSSSSPYSSSAHLVDRLTLDGESTEFLDEPFGEDRMPSDNLLSKDSNLSQRACVDHSTYPAQVSEESGGYSLQHGRTHSSSSFSMDQSSVHSLEDDASLPFTCVNSVLNDHRHELKFQTSVKSDRIYRSSNSFSNEEIVEHLRRIEDENLTNDDENCVLDAVESSIISNILSIDLDSCDDSLSLPHGLTDLLHETDDQRGSSWNSFTSGESGFLFAKQNGFAGQAANFEPYYSNLGQVPQNCTTKEHYLSKPQHPACRPPSLVPPGFSMPSREAPPGFSAYEKTGGFPRTSSGSFVNTSSLPNNLLQMPLAGNNGSNSDIDFLDPAILSRGDSKPTNGLNISGLSTRPAVNQQMGEFDNETRLRLLMQQQARADQDSKYSQIFFQQTSTHKDMGFPGHTGVELSSSGDVYGCPSRLMDQCQSFESSFAQLSQQKFGNGYISNGYQHSLDEVQRRNEAAIAEHQRSEKLGLNKYLSGYGDLMFQMPSSGDVYTRVFGM
nr:CCR4-NOT transcription complex subunit 4-like isoform X1 [Coffea arabica]